MPTPRRICTRCGLIILGPLQVLEISRITHAEPECNRWLLCGDCGHAITNYLKCRPATLERLELAEVAR